MTDLDLNVEVSPGTPIQRAAAGAIRIAKLLNVTVWFDFNGIRCCAAPEWAEDIIVKNYHAAIERNQTK